MILIALITLISLTRSVESVCISVISGGFFEALTADC